MNWGIIGYGEIAPSFLESLSGVKGQRIYAIASPSNHKTLRITTENDSKVKIFADYQAIYNDPNIDIVYICTTNDRHKENVICSLRAGKHVLCEKPIGVCKNDTIEMMDEAKRNNRFLMEGMWTRFLPAYRQFIRLIRENIIGQPTFMNVEFGFFSNWGPERRLLNKSLHGGVVLDNTDYNVFLSQDVYQDLPEKILACGTIAQTGVESSCSIIMKFSKGQIAQSFSSFQQKTRHDAVVYGEKGSIILENFWHGSKIRLLLNDTEPISFDYPFSSTGFVHEINEVVNCINNGNLESEIIPHRLSIDIATILDEVIRQIHR